MAKLVPIRQLRGDPAEMTDEALLAACAANDPAGLAALFDRYDADVYQFLVRMRGVDDHVVDDLVQEVFLSAYNAAGKFRGGASVRTWLLAIAGNLAKTHVRAEVRRRERGATFLERIAKVQTPPDVVVEQRELIEKMVEALGTLPVDQRIAFLLCDVEESRGVDVAEALGIRTGTLYRRLHDARKALRAAVLGDDHEQ